MATLPIGAATDGKLGNNYVNIANFVPEVWSQELIIEAERNLVIAKLVDRRFEKGYTYGDVVHIANLHNITANEVNVGTTATLYDSVQNTTPININNWYHAGVSEADAIRKMNRPDYLKAVVPKLGYALAKQIDTNLATQFNDFVQTVGTNGVKVDDDTLVAAKEYLDLADAPFEDRSLIIDPETLGDILKIDKFVRMDYVAGGVIESGRVGNIYGCPVYITNNLEEISSNYHAAAMMHKGALGLIMAYQKVNAFRDWAHFSDGILADALWGYNELIDTFGVWIKTRS